MSSTPLDAALNIGNAMQDELSKLEGTSLKRVEFAAALTAKGQVGVTFATVAVAEQLRVVAEELAAIRKHLETKP